MPVVELCGGAEDVRVKFSAESRGRHRQGCLLWKRRPPSPSWWTKLADGGLLHNHHKPRLAGYELGGSE
jgi:hypothetical protein